MEVTQNVEAAKYLINGFLIGLQCTMMLVFIIITIIDLKNTKKQWKQTDDWIKSIDMQMKLEKGIVDRLVEEDERLDKIEEHLGIKKEEEDEQE